MRREMMLDEVDDRFEQDLGEKRSRLARGIRRLSTGVPFAAIGMFTESARRGYEMVGQTLAIPPRLVRLTASAPRRLVGGLRVLPDRAGEMFLDSEKAGRDAVDRVLGRKSLAQARRQLRATRSQAKSVTTSVARAARATATAVESAAEAAFDPRDTRPYEERTRGELYELACDRQIEGRSAMNKKQLVKALRRDR